jgi:hypothetical protein
MNILFLLNRARDRAVQISSSIAGNKSSTARLSTLNEREAAHDPSERKNQK